MGPEPVQNNDLDTADDFVAALFDSARRAGGEYSVIFRGVSDAEKHMLVPKALRPGTSLWHGYKWEITDNLNARGQVEGELRTLGEFCRWVDASGLRVPVRLPGPVLRYFRDLENTYAPRANWADWPPDELLPLLGLAQHYGVPTRLLDWSEHPLKAAYFCLSDEVLSGTDVGNRRIAVWALSGLGLYAFPFLWKTAGDVPVILVAVPYADNPNLHAQQGVFTLHRTRFDDKSPPDRTPLDVVVRNVTNVALKLSRFTLPYTEGPELYKQLARLGIVGATIYPGYAGCAEVLRQHQLLPG